MEICDLLLHIIPYGAPLLTRHFYPLMEHHQIPDCILFRSKLVRPRMADATADPLKCEQSRVKVKVKVKVIVKVSEVKVEVKVEVEVEVEAKVS